MTRVTSKLLHAVGYVWTFRRTYRWARWRVAGWLRLESTIDRHLYEAGRHRCFARSGLYTRYDVSVDRAAVASFYRMAALHCFLGRQYADLRGEEPTRVQWQALATIGALAKIQDYLVDRLPGFPQAEQDRIYADPNGYRPTNLAGALFKQTWLQLQTLMPREEYPEYHRVLDQIYQAQRESRRQRDPNVTPDELRAITMRKGGYGIMAGLHVLNPHLSPRDPEYQALLSIGHWGQMVEDVLDEREDRREGNHTLVGRMDAVELAREIIALRDRTLELIGGLSHYQTANREACLYRVFLPSVPAIVRLRQLADGRDILEAWRRGRFIEAARLAFDFASECLAQVQDFDPTRYLHAPPTTALPEYQQAA